MKNKYIQLNLRVGNDKDIRVNTDTRTGRLFPKTPEFFRIHNQIEDIDDMKCARVVSFNNYMSGGSNGIAKTAIRNDRICIIWDNDYNFETLKLNLKLLSEKEIEHNSLIVGHKKHWYEKPELEVINLYSFIMQLLITEYKKEDVVELEDFKPYLEGMYLTINKNNIAIISNKYDICAMASNTGMGV